MSQIQIRRSTVQSHIHFIRAVMVGMKSMLENKLVPELKDIEIVISHLEEMDNLLGKVSSNNYLEQGSYRSLKKRYSPQKLQS